MPYPSRKAAHAEGFGSSSPANPQALGECRGTPCIPAPLKSPQLRVRRGLSHFQPQPASTRADGTTSELETQEDLFSKILTTDEAFSGRSSTRTCQPPGQLYFSWPPWEAEGVPAHSSEWGAAQRGASEGPSCSFLDRS